MSHTERKDLAPPIARWEESTTLAQTLSAVRSGEKRGLLLLGEAGVGKTHMLTWLRDLCRGSGLNSALVRGSAHSVVGLPLTQLIEELDADRDPPRSTALAHTSAGLGDPSLMERLLQSIRLSTRSRPVAIFIDDAHAYPRELLQNLLMCLRVLDGPLLFAATARPDGGNEAVLRDLTEPSGDLWIQCMNLHGLSKDGTALLSQTILGDPLLPSTLDELYSRTSGNPLFVHETLRRWRELEAIRRIGAYWSVAPRDIGTIAPTLEDAVATRLGTLPGHALDVARYISLWGREVGIRELALLGFALEPLIETLANLVESGIVRESDNTPPMYRLAHPAYEAFLSTGLISTRKSALHGQIVKALRSLQSLGRGVSEQELAYHALHAPFHSDARHNLLIRALTEAQSKGSYEDIAYWHAQLAEDSSNSPEARIHALLGQARATENFDPTAALQVYEVAEREASSEAMLALARTGRASAQRRLGQYEDALTCLNEALGACPPTHRFELWHAIATLEAIRCNWSAAEAIWSRLSRETADAPRQSSTVGHLAQLHYSIGNLPKAAALAEKALTLTADRSYRAFLETNLSWYWLLLGRWNEAEKLLEASLKNAEVTADLWNQAILLSNASRLASWRGQHALALDLGIKGVRLAQSLGNPAYLVTTTDTLAQALLESGAATESVSLLAPVVDLLSDETEPIDPYLSHLVLGDAYLALSLLKEAEDCAQEASHWLHKGGRFFEIAIDRLRAEVLLARGDASGAYAFCRPWIASPSPIMLEQARIMEVAGRALRIMRWRADALTAASDAVALYEALGASTRLATLRDWMSRMAPKPQGRPPSTRPFQLTDREMDVLRLVASGRTNKEIARALVISTGTARKHVENLRTKAGVSSRVELVSLATRLGMDLRAE